MPMKPRNRGAFTLIELLIVVAIIAILAAIAVPNFLEAQVRAKGSRAKNDMRSLGVALEAYCVDHNCYISGNSWGVAGSRPSMGANDPKVLERLSTPVAYISNAFCPDIFKPRRRSGSLITGTGPINSDVGTWPTTPLPPDRDAHLYQTYLYTGMLENGANPTGLDRALAADIWSDIQRGPAAAWFVHSAGPMEAYINMGGVVANSPASYVCQLVYDPSNGTVSFGNIFRRGGGHIGRGNNVLSAIP